AHVAIPLPLFCPRYAPHLGCGYGAVIFAYSFGATVTHSLSLTTNTRPPARRFSPAGVNFAPRSCMYILSPVRSCVAAIASRSFFRSVEPARSRESQSTANAVKPPAEVESRFSLKRSWYFCASGFKPGMSASADQLVVQRTLSASFPSAFTYSLDTWPPRMPPYAIGFQFNSFIVLCARTIADAIRKGKARGLSAARRVIAVTTRIRRSVSKIGHYRSLAITSCFRCDRPDQVLRRGHGVGNHPGR